MFAKIIIQTFILCLVLRVTHSQSFTTHPYTMLLLPNKYSEAGFSLGHNPLEPLHDFVTVKFLALFSSPADVYVMTTDQFKKFEKTPNKLPSEYIQEHSVKGVRVFDKEMVFNAERTHVVLYNAGSITLQVTCKYSGTYGNYPAGTNCV